VLPVRRYASYSPNSANSIPFNTRGRLHALARRRELCRSARVRELHSPLFSVIEGLLVRGASAGVFRRDVDPVQLWLTIVAVSYFYFSNVHTLSVALGRDLLTREAMAERRDHVVGLIADYLRDGRAP
jgi:TetR/AcrR family transcriptional regulator